MKKKKIIFTLIAIMVLIGLVLLGKNSHGAVSCKKQSDKNLVGVNDNINTCPAGGYDTYVNQQLGISFNKPANWNVFIADGTVYVKPSLESPSGVFLTPILRAHPKMQALSFIRFVYDMAKKVYPDLALSDKRANSNDTMAEVSATFKNKNVPVKGFYMVSIQEGRGLFCGYEDVNNNFDNQHTAMREILRTLKVQPMEFYNGTSQGQAYGGNTAVSNIMGPTIDTSHFVTKGSVDGTMYVACPPDWQAGGGNYFYIAHSPDGGMGVFTSNDHQPKTFDPQSYLMSQLMPFLKCSNTAIAKTEANYDYMKLLQSQGVPSNAVNFYGETINGTGLRLRYCIMVSASSLGPAGGYVTTYGVFSPPELFDRNFNTLVAMAFSITADNAVIMGNLRANLDRLNAASKTISQTGDVVISAINSGNANTNRAMDKYNYYLSGEEARYSPLENKIYVVDSNLENYASNPNYPQEMLTTVPDSKWNTLPHDRTYVP